MSPSNKAPAEAEQGTTPEEEWDEQAIDSGELIKWEMNKPVIGAFISRREVVIEEGEAPVPMLIFEVKDKGRMFCWAGPKLAEAFAPLAPGAYVRVEWVSEKSVGRPSPMKVFSVKVRPTPATPAESNVKAPGTAGTAEEPF